MLRGLESSLHRYNLSEGGAVARSILKMTANVSRADAASTTGSALPWITVRNALTV